MKLKRLYLFSGLAPRFSVMVALITQAIGVTFADGLLCDEEWAGILFQQENYESAFHVLRECENSSDEASASALTALAVLYLMEDIPGLGSTREREQKSWDLMEKAALTGNEDSVVSLARMYINGSPQLGFEPEREVGICLLDLTANDADLDEDELVKRNSVVHCLGLPGQTDY